jgi:predicted DNA-binding transcriptional regulator YafY
MQVVTFTYKNHRGETSVRLVRPIMIAFGSNKYHTEPQWLLHAYDLQKAAERAFGKHHVREKTFMGRVELSMLKVTWSPANAL